jgi:hypothetical protein
VEGSGGYLQLILLGGAAATDLNLSGETEDIVERWRNLCRAKNVSAMWDSAVYKFTVKEDLSGIDTFKEIDLRWVAEENRAKA